jgi:hypothetical protein
VATGRRPFGTADDSRLRATRAGPGLATIRRVGPLLRAGKYFQWLWRGRGMVTVKNNDWKIMIEKQRPEIPIENTDRKYRSKIPIETFTSQNID